MIRSIIFDWKRTLYDPETKSLLAGSLELLTILKQNNINLILIGKGDETMNDEVNKLGVKKYFSQVLFNNKKDEDLFNKFIFGKNPLSTLVIGDRVRSEIEIGNSLDMVTIWIKQGKFSEEEPLNDNQKPTYIVNSVFEIIELLKNKFNISA